MPPSRPRPGLGLALPALVVLALVLVPFALVGEPLEALALGALDGAHGQVAVASVVVASLAADVVLPVPSSLVATAAGALLGWLPGALAATLGMLAGGLVGHRLGAVARGRLVTRLVPAADMAWLEGVVARHGALAVAALRPIPVLAETSVIVAGAAGLPLRRFLPACLLSSLGVALAHAGAGAWAVGLPGFLAVLAALALPGLAWAVAKSLRRGVA